MLLTCIHPTILSDSCIFVVANFKKNYNKKALNLKLFAVYDIHMFFYLFIWFSFWCRLSFKSCFLTVDQNTQPVTPEMTQHFEQTETPRCSQWSLLLHTVDAYSTNKLSQKDIWWHKAISKVSDGLFLTMTDGTSQRETDEKILKMDCLLRR